MAWQFKSDLRLAATDDRAWKDYDAAESNKIEAAFQRGNKSMVSSGAPVVAGRCLDTHHTAPSNQKLNETYVIVFGDDPFQVSAARSAAWPEPLPLTQ